MKKTLALLLILVALTLKACAPLPAAAPTPLLPTQPPAAVETRSPIPVSPTPLEPAQIWKPYTNSDFGLSFQYPSHWFGPDETISGDTLRVEVGSDIVFPYGESPDVPSNVRNSYKVVIQYTKDNQNPYFEDTYQTLLTMQDGQWLSGARSTLIRVRQLELGGFSGFEYISTLSEQAQTEPAYAREVMLVDDQSNLLTIFGTPNNVETGNGVDWRAVYRSIDEANQPFFHKIVESMTIMR